MTHPFEEITLNKCINKNQARIWIEGSILEVNKFSNNTLFCEINFYGELETLLIEIVENTYLNLLNTTDLGDNISIEYKL